MTSFFQRLKEELYLQYEIQLIKIITCLYTHKEFSFCHVHNNFVHNLVLQLQVKLIQVFFDELMMTQSKSHNLNFMN